MASCTLWNLCTAERAPITTRVSTSHPRALTVHCSHQSTGEMGTWRNALVMSLLIKMILAAMRARMPTSLPKRTPEVSFMSCRSSKEMVSFTASSPQERLTIARSFFVMPSALSPSSTMNRGLMRMGTMGTVPSWMKAPVFASSRRADSDFSRPAGVSQKVGWWKAYCESTHVDSRSRPSTSSCAMPGSSSNSASSRKNSVQRPCPPGWSPRGAILKASATGIGLASCSPPVSHGPSARASGRRSDADQVRSSMGEGSSPSSILAHSAVALPIHSFCSPKTCSLPGR